MKFEDVIRNREACRNFGDYKLTQEEFDKILEAGRLAPSAKDMQPVKIIVVKSEDAIKKLDEVTPCRYNAPQVLIVCGNTKEGYKEENYNGYDIDASICATHMLLEATNLGLDDIWVRRFDVEKLKKEFNLSEELEPLCLIPLGKRSDEYTPSVFHNKRKEINEIVDYI